MDDPPDSLAKAPGSDVARVAPIMRARNEGDVRSETDASDPRAKRQTIVDDVENNPSGEGALSADDAQAASDAGPDAV